ncbi:two-component system sensor histidine kinase EvgS [Pseudomonas frederiksbergensis]|uniref:ATP-binding protein n=1 Tax=Pseudomonas frederiksbergensis TaxID=104087 RepID=UPI003D1C41EE
MKQLWVTVVALVFATHGAGTLGESSTTVYWLTAEERAWIAEHPVLRVAVLEHAPPTEFMDNGTASGLSAEYLDSISRNTGLKFTYIATGGGAERVALLRQGKADLISAIRHIGPTFIPDLSLTTPYHISAAIVVTRAKSPTYFDLGKLAGKTVVIDAKGPYESLLRAKARNVRIIKSGSAQEALTLVAEGDADATLGTQSYLMPHFGPQFEGVLQLSGVIAPLASEISMATRADQPLLFSILQKSLEIITVENAYDLHDQWIISSGYGARALKSFTEDYSNEVLLAGLVLAILLGLVHLTHRQHRRAVRSEREKAKFLAVMSHEIRSPMNAVLAAVELLSLTKLDHEQRHLSTLAASGANTLLRLLDDVLDMSRLEAQQLQLEHEPVDIAVLVGGIVALYGPRAQAKGIELTLDVQGSTEHLMLDETRVTQILHNLISNAIKFTEAGFVRVTAGIGDAHDGDLKRLDISVADTGIGISEQAQDKLFEPYSQANNAYKRSGGTGLGLVICRELIELMGGTISLESTVGAGTVVGFALKAEVARDQIKDRSETNELATFVAPTDNTMPIADERTKDLRILVVEDTLANQEVLLAQMRSFGIEAVLAPDGAQAILKFELQRFDLVLLDCDLPDMNGYSVAPALRAIEAYGERARCPIIAISASTGSEHDERCFDADMDGTLSKPIQLGKLKSVIELWCDVPIRQTVPVQASAKTFGLNEARQAIQDDLLNLLEAVLLGNVESALHRAHRLNGAALSLSWIEMALSAQKLESLLRSAVPMDDAHYRIHLREITQQWHHQDPDRSDSAYEK